MASDAKPMNENTSATVPRDTRPWDKMEIVITA